MGGGVRGVWGEGGEGGEGLQLRLPCVPQGAIFQEVVSSTHTLHQRWSGDNR